VSHECSGRCPTTFERLKILAECGAAETDSSPQLTNPGMHGSSLLCGIGPVEWIQRSGKVDDSLRLAYVQLSIRSCTTF
jgi:hypothetical protein